ncbi:class I SAM-dependent methyltransferase [Algoriphagus litoralis]|uniref:class I SAM-dependent methyltransferase n=1 Tax=Algoriphagus litoralis TaxID=2202829 RepID=UPI000DB97117|nr:class I SAM-dependent methyltransferase [Algoriphagus litoralis]
MDSKTAHSLTEHEKKDKALFDAISPKYLEKDLAPQCSIARKHRLLSSLKNVSFDHTSRVLEVGCGAGFSVKYLDKPYSAYVGVDYSQGLIDYANQYNSKPKAQFICANIKEYQPEEKFDVIFMIGVLHHFDDMKGILSHIVTLLKPGGVVVANEPQSSNPLIQGLRTLRTKLDKSYSDDQVQLLPENLKELYEAVGLKEVQVLGQGYFSTPFAEVVLRPKWIIKVLSMGSIGLDNYIQRVDWTSLRKIAWNVVGVGFKSKI